MYILHCITLYLRVLFKSYARIVSLDLYIALIFCCHPLYYIMGW